ncbi:Smr/MutS family protein [Croceiramulus getboli]|nr:DNA mismatch repair protein MutS [Flavobacteriaceae bacterium YJPT1-3]
MSFQIGQEVIVVDDDLQGVVKAVNHPTYVISMQDGFDLEFHFREIIAAPESGIPVKEEEEWTAHQEEQEIAARKKKQEKPKKGIHPPMEVDLHIHQLTENERGMSAHDKLILQTDTARRQLEFAIKNKIPRVVFIHGVGAGVLKMELDYLFSRYEQVTHYDADFKTYGMGATEVRIFQNP